MTDPLPSADIQMIQRIIPHRYPFLLVDKVVDINGTQSAVGIKNVTMNEPHFHDYRSHGTNGCRDGRGHA